MQTYESTTGPQTTSSSGSTAEQAKEKVQEQAQQAAGQARGALRGQVDQRSTQAGERVTTVASDVRSVSEQLREQGKDQPAKLAEQAADRVERVGSYLRDNDADRILGDVEDFGRRQPWAVMFGGLTVGFLASRFLKASSTRRYEERYQSRYESSGRLPARTSDVSVGAGLGTTGTTGVGTGAGVGTGVGGDLGGTPVSPPPITREPGITDPAPGRAADDVSLSGGVMPPERPGATAPGQSRFEGSR